MAKFFILLTEKVRKVNAVTSWLYKPLTLWVLDLIITTLKKRIFLYQK